MSGILAKVAMNLLYKLATETFFAKVLCYGLSALAKKTTNSLDDKTVKAIADSLGVSIE